MASSSAALSCLACSQALFERLVQALEPRARAHDLALEVPGLAFDRVELGPAALQILRQRVLLAGQPRDQLGRAGLDGADLGGRLIELGPHLLDAGRRALNVVPELRHALLEGREVLADVVEAAVEGVRARPQLRQRVGHAIALSAEPALELGDRVVAQPHDRAHRIGHGRADPVDVGAELVVQLCHLGVQALGHAEALVEIRPQIGDPLVEQAAHARDLPIDLRPHPQLVECGRTRRPRDEQESAKEQ